MEITTRRVDDSIEVSATGRLDGHWADHLSSALEEIIRQGNDRIRLNLQRLEYISSLGIRVLVSFHKKLAVIQGSLTITESSDPVRKVLEMVGLTALLAAPGQALSSAKTEITKTITASGLRMEVFSAPGSQKMSCSLIGDSSLVTSSGYTEKDCHSVAYPDNAIGLGLGAFGSSFDECKTRFGEFLSVAGAAAYQPADGSNAPDFLMAEGTLIPEVQVLYGLKCEGSFQSLGRFEAEGEAGAVRLSQLADLALQIADAPEAAFVFVGESAGLVGASLRKPPVGGANGNNMFAHPGIRSWLSFTTERAYHRALAIGAGVLSRDGKSKLGPLVRPLNGAGSVHGHVHATAFPYRPLKKGRLDLGATVRSLFEQESLLGLLHLIGDDRGAVGVSESEFVRGACWIAPLSEVRV